MNERVGKQSLLGRYGGEEYRQIGSVVDISAVRKSKPDVMLRRRTLQVIEIDYRVILFEKVRCSKGNASDRNISSEHIDSSLIVDRSHTWQGQNVLLYFV